MQRHFHKKLSITLLSPFVYKYIFKHIATNVVIYITKQNDFFSQNFLQILHILSLQQYPLCRDTE